MILVVGFEPATVDSRELYALTERRVVKVSIYIHRNRMIQESVKPLLTDSDRMAQWLRLVDIMVLGGSIPTADTFSLQRGSNPCIFILFRMCNSLI